MTEDGRMRSEDESFVPHDDSECACCRRAFAPHAGIHLVGACSMHGYFCQQCWSAHTFKPMLSAMFIGPGVPPCYRNFNAWHSHADGHRLDTLTRGT